MAETITIDAEVRERAGKGAARAARRSGKVPAVLYGNKMPPQSINLDGLVLARLARDPAFATTLYSIKVDGKEQKALAREVQTDPVSDALMHVDFLRVSERTRVTSEVPVQFINEETCPGLKAGGVLNVVRYTIEVVCRADAIPEAVVVDLANAELNDSIHISAVTLDEGVAPTITDRDFTIATIAAPSGLKAEEDEDGEDGEGEGEGDEAEAEESSED
ncbi:MAG: 50S ribosomal protein L25/general stress protein Ctc [Pseudomonadota bacterium]